MQRENLRHYIGGAALVLLAGSITFAQQPTEADQVKSRQRIFMMEGVLERAVSNGADNMVRQMKAVMGDAPQFTGIPEVRGFRLDGYGVFFDVEVPALRLPVTWPLRYMFRDNRETMGIVNELRAMMGESEPRQRERLAQVVRQLEQQAQVPAALRGTGRIGAAAVPVGGGAQPQPDPAAYDDPEEHYTREVKAALVDAMIENSGPIALGAEEWLTVAARDNVPRDPLIPTDAADTHTVLFRIKGSDLGGVSRRPDYARGNPQEGRDPRVLDASFVRGLGPWSAPRGPLVLRPPRTPDDGPHKGPGTSLNGNPSLRLVSYLVLCTIPA